MSGTACGAATCTGNQLTTDACNGLGGCTAGTPTACSGNLNCNAGGTACLASCWTNDPTGDANCVSGHYCDGFACQALVATGGTCTRNGQCVSGSCVSGSCVAPFAHTVTFTGAASDFTAATDLFATTSAGYSAYVTWDATNVYVGYAGGDFTIGGATGEKFLELYFDTDPGAGTGATTGKTYNTQTPSFPAGFGAEYHLMFASDGSSMSLQHYSAGTWTASAPRLSSI